MLTCSPYSPQHWPAGQVGKLLPQAALLGAGGWLEAEDGADVLPPEGGGGCDCAHCILLAKVHRLLLASKSMPGGQATKLPFLSADRPGAAQGTDCWLIGCAAQHGQLDGS